MMSLKTQAVRLGNSYRLPVHILYRSTPGRLGGDLSFSDAIRAKYASVDEQELPSADFEYPKFGEADASELLQSLTRQLIQLNRIRIRMNVSNYRYLQRYSSAINFRCEQLFNLLQTQNNMYSGVTADAIRELQKIHRELRAETGKAAESAASKDAESVKRTLRAAAADTDLRVRELLERELPGRSSASLLMQGRGAFLQSGVMKQTLSGGPEASRSRNAGALSGAVSAAEDESALILRILSASSRGNGTRERYMRELITRLNTVETDGSGREGSNAYSPAAVTLLQKAETELFHLSQNGGDPSISLWHSEAAKQFFWRIQRAPETERRFLLEAGGFSSLVTLEKVLRTMDDEAFRSFAEPLLARAEESLRDPGMMDRTAMPSADYIDNDWVSLYHTAEQVFLQAAESSDDDRTGRTGGSSDRGETPGERGQDGTAGTVGARGSDGYSGAAGRSGSDGYNGVRGDPGVNPGADSLINILYEFFEDHEEEEWELFRTELTHASGQVTGDNREDFPADALSELPAEALRELTEVIAAPVPDAKEQLILEKETLFRILREERGSWRLLRTLVMETIRRIAVIRENQKEYMTLADSIMNLSTEQWTQFKKDVRTLREEDLDIRAMIPETILHETVSVSEHRRLDEEVRENRELTVRQQESEETRQRTVREQEDRIREISSRENLMQEGVRMSSEKLEFLKVLREEVTRRDTVFTDTGRKIFLHTVLKGSDAGQLIRPSFRELSSEGRENWSRFVTELLHLDRHVSENGSGAGAGYFGKLAGRFGTGNSPEEAGTAIPGTQAAIRLLEQQRLERTMDTETLTERVREAEAAAHSDAERVIYRLLPRQQQAASDEEGSLPAFTNADITVQRNASNRNAGKLASNAADILRQAELSSRTESYTDIEFETVHHTVREEESKEMKSVTETLERHERDIAELLKAQKLNAERNLPKEVIRQINDMLRMERLRGGR